MSAATTFLVGQLIDGSGSAPVPRAFVRLEGPRITAVGRQSELGDLDGQGTVIDAPDCTLMPGLIDAHVHLAYSGALHSRAFQSEASELSYSALALRAAAYACQTLEWGVTSVRDLNAPGGVIIDLGRAISQGHVPGPRVVACGLGLSVTGGHMDKGGWGDHVTLEGMALPCDGAESFRRGVRQQVKRGAGCLKINLCGGSIRDWTVPWKSEMAEDEVCAAIEEAHRLERKVAAHTSGGPAITAAVRLGLDSVEHGRWLSEECVEAMAERGTTYVPTLLVQENHFEHPWESQGADLASQRWLELGREAMWTSLSLARAANVRVATGTDAGFMLPHGPACARELNLLVQGGYTPLEAITAATSHGAALLDLPEVGTVRPGQLADLLLVRGDPLTDVQLLQRQEVLRVFKGGVEATVPAHRRIQETHHA